MRCPCNDTWHGLAGLASTQTASNEHVSSYCRSRWSNLPESTVPLAEVVVSHCSHPLSWLRAELAEAEALGLLRVARVTVYAKCGNPVRNASDDWLVRALPNVGRNDGTFAQHVATQYRCLLPLVLFIKDRPDAGFSSMKNRRVAAGSMAHEASAHGFACGYRPASSQFAAYHLSRLLRRFRFTKYYKTYSHNQQLVLGRANGSKEAIHLGKSVAQREAALARCATWDSEAVDDATWQTAASGAAADPAALEGGLVVTNCTRWGHTLRNYAFFAHVQRVGTWLNRSALLDDDELAAAFAQPLWRVCFGGAFAATRSQIWARRAETWRRLSDALSRGNNIEEGHYSERLWGLLLAPPLTDDAAAAMLCAGHAGDSTSGLFKNCRCDAKYDACVARPAADS